MTANMPIANRPLFALLLAGLIGGLVLPAAPVHAQDSGPSQQDKAMHYSLYYESFKNEEYAAAKSDLDWILANAPGFPKGDDRNFERKVELHTGLASKAQKESDRQAHLDSAATVLAAAPGTMDKLGLSYDQYEWELERGRFLQQYGDGLSSPPEGLKTAEAHYRKAFDLAPEKIDAYYIQRLLRGHLENNEQQKALDFIKAVESERGDDKEVQKVLSSVRSDIFGKNPQAQVKYLEKQYEAHPDSTGLMVSLFDAYVQQGNVTKASKLAPKLMEKDLPAETVREIAQMRLDDGRPEAAIKAYDRAVEQGAELTAEDYFKRGQAYQQMGSFSKARREYREALNTDPKFARAYVGIGDLYARAVQNCSEGELGRKDKAVYWAAVDKYQEAKQVDEALQSVVESKIGSYRKVFPTKEDIFYREDWERGGSFTIDYGCYAWIGETTTVRSAP